MHNASDERRTKVTVSLTQCWTENDKHNEWEDEKRADEVNVKLDLSESESDFV